MPEELTRLLAVAINHRGKWKLHWVNVTPFEGLTRFHAQSERGRATTYLVDLDLYWGLGWCGCEDFGINKEPTVKLWKADERVVTDEWRCKHVIACRMYLGDDLANMFLAARRHETNKTRRYEND